MSREHMYIRNELGGILLYGGTADTLTDFNVYTCYFALKRTEHKSSVSHQVKSGPVEIGKIIVYESGCVG